ncbi:MAG: hypothetical protein COB83_00970 [Gammaproteobacteria bacterium]|nr:MAG: hypothetical protein COB83_00970 [Gammaproteobacteria bacterium]
MKVEKIQTNEDLKLALSRVEKLWDSEDPQEVVELNSLATLISDYEDKLLCQERMAQPEFKVDIDDR